MYKFKIIESAQSLINSDIVEVETKIGIIIPKCITDLYLHTNGGIIEGHRNVFINNDGNEFSFKYFMPIKYKFSDNCILIEDCYADFVLKRKLIAPKYFPFALDGGGFPYCIDCISHNIFLANFDNYNDTDYMVKVSPSLSDFINGMQTEDEAYE